MDFKDKIALITGGASGIGRAVALALASRGAHIVLADLDEKGLEEAAGQVRSLSRQALAVRCDVASDQDMQNLAEVVFNTFGRLDILMNNAGVMLRSVPEKTSMEDWNWVLGINLMGVIRGVNAFVPQMIERGQGVIINTSSVGGLIGGRPYSIGYSTSKFAVTGFTEILYKHLKPKGVSVFLLCPGGVATNIVANTRFVNGEEDPALANMPAPTMGSEWVVHPDDAARMVIEAIEQDRFLILTEPSRVRPLLKKRAEDLQATLDAQIAFGLAKNLA